MNVVFVWYLTCTEHKRIPLIIPLLILGATWIPILGLCIALFSAILLPLFWDDLNYEFDVELKNNWINRTFFAYHAK